MANLYELMQDYQYLYDLLSNGDVIDAETGEVDPVVAEQMQINQDALKDKLQNYGIIYKQLMADAKMFEEEEKNLQARRKRAENNAEWLKQTLQNVMIALSMKDFSTSKVKLSFINSKRVEITDESKLDTKYLVIKTTTQPNKTMIASDIKAGLVVDGAELVEHQNIQIK